MEDKTIVVQRPVKSPGLAGFLGIFPFGVGALYNGQKAKALLYLIIFAGLINAMDRHTSGAFVPLLFAGFIFFQFFDNIQSAKAINAAAANLPQAEAALGTEEIMTSRIDLLGRLPHRAGRGAHPGQFRGRRLRHPGRLLAGRGHRDRAQARV